jgi:hypothetical protein
MRDIKEMIGIIMRVLDGDEISEREILDLQFEADGELADALNEAYIKLLEFVHDRDLRQANSGLDEMERAALADSLGRIVNLCDTASDIPIS